MMAGPMRGELLAAGRDVSAMLARVDPHLRPIVEGLASRIKRIEDAMAPGIETNAFVVARMLTYATFSIGVRRSDVTSGRRSRELARARWAVCWVAFKITDYSYTRIGVPLGGLDHSSVIHGIRRADELRGSELAFRRLTDAMLDHFMNEGKEEGQPCLL